TGEMENIAAAVHLFPFRIDAIEEAPRMLLQHVTNPRRLDDVDADLAGNAHPKLADARRVLSPGRGCALAAPSRRPSPLRSCAFGGGSQGPRLAHTPLPGATRRAPRNILIRPSRPSRGSAAGRHRFPASRHCDKRGAALGRWRGA